MGQINGLNQRSNCLLNKQITDTDHGMKHGLGGVLDVQCDHVIHGSCRRHL